MWQRSEIKARAKTTLGSSYWNCFGIILLVILLISVGNTIFNLVHTLIMLLLGVIPSATHDGMSIQELIEIITSSDYIIFYSTRILFVFAASMLVGTQFFVGERKFLLNTINSSNSFSDITDGFIENYWGIAKASIIRDLLVTIGSILFIIPGIVLQLRYCFIEFIMAENSAIGGMEALRLSKKITDGHKFRIFVFELSFIGWYILGSLACVVGIFFVSPYVKISGAHLYLELKKEAIEKGIISAYELSPTVNA